MLIELAVINEIEPIEMEYPLENGQSESVSVLNIPLFRE